MKTYSQYKPTEFDCAGLNAEDVGANWLVLPCGRNRDSDALDESNFHTALQLLGGESETVSVHRFGHWACGWFEIIVVKPDTEAHKEALSIEARLDNYPILDDDDHSEREMNAANEVWKDCYRPKERVEYIRKHRSQFEFHGLSDLLAVVRGKYFNGYAGELLH